MMKLRVWLCTFASFSLLNSNKKYCFLFSSVTIFMPSLYFLITFLLVLFSLQVKYLPKPTLELFSLWPSSFFLGCPRFCWISLFSYLPSLQMPPRLVDSRIPFRFYFCKMLTFPFSPHSILDMVRRCPFPFSFVFLAVCIIITIIILSIYIALRNVQSTSIR